MALGKLGLAGEDGEGCTPRLKDGDGVGVHARRITRSRSRATSPLRGDRRPVNLEARLVVGRGALSDQHSQTQAIPRRHHVVKGGRTIPADVQRPVPRCI